MKEPLYTQCVMHLAVGEALQIHTAWIPAEFAKKGKTVKIRIDGKWVNGLKVVEVGDSKPQSQIYDRDHLTQRKQSDI